MSMARESQRRGLLSAKQGPRMQQTMGMGFSDRACLLVVVRLPRLCGVVVEESVEEVGGMRRRLHPPPPVSQGDPPKLQPVQGSILSLHILSTAPSVPISIHACLSAETKYR